MSYINELTTIVEECRKRIANIDASIEKLKGSKTYSTEYINTAISGFNSDKEQTYTAYTEKAKKAYTDYLDRLQKKVESLSGSSVNTEDLVLLSSQYIKLSQAEFDVLVKRHSDNYTMSKALRKYATENELDFPMVILSIEEKKAYAYEILYQFVSYFRCADLTWALACSENSVSEINSKLPE